MAGFSAIRPRLPDAGAVQDVERGNFSWDIFSRAGDNGGGVGSGDARPREQTGDHQSSGDQQPTDCEARSPGVWTRTVDHR
jgi:hypothetical protein